jgi:hypothetical protein
MEGGGPKIYGTQGSGSGPMIPQKELGGLIESFTKPMNVSYWNAVALCVQIDGVSAVHSHYYLLASDLYRLEGKHADFYRSVIHHFVTSPWGIRYSLTQSVDMISSRKKYHFLRVTCSWWSIETSSTVR